MAVGDYNELCARDKGRMSARSARVGDPEAPVVILGNVLELDVESSTTIREVKEKIEYRKKIPVDQQQLIYAGKRLENLRTLSYYAINRFSTFTLSNRPNALPRITPQATRFTPQENVFPTNSEAVKTIGEWQALAEIGNFDADTHIVDPEAHNTALESLERTVVFASELHRQSRVLDFAAMPKLEELLIRLPTTQAPSWVLSRVLDVSGDWTGEAKQAFMSLCDSYSILQSVIDKFELLVRSRFAKDFFSILILRDKKDVAEIVKIPHTLLTRIADTLLAALAVIQQEGIQEIEEIVAPIIKIFFELLGHFNDTVDVLDACRVMAHLLDVGLVSYVGSHSSRFYQNLLSNGVPRLAFNSEGSLGFEFALYPLACLHGFLNAQSVWAFDVHSGTKAFAADIPPKKAKLSILTTIDALADIWGPIYAELVSQEKPARVKKYNVSKRCIRRVPNKNDSTDSGVIRCHWYSWAGEQRRRLSSLIPGSSSRTEHLTMGLDDKLLIRTEMTVKHGCTYSLTDYEMNYSDHIREAGPKPSSWRFDGVAVTLQVAAPKVMAIQIEGQSKRIPETTVKEFAWQKWNSCPGRANPGILNNYYGVEISNCTGNARRVPLKSIFVMHSVQEFLERQIPGWRSTPWGIDLIKAIKSTSDDEIFSFWNRHAEERPRVGQLVASVLDVLHDTGCTDRGLQAAFLHQNHESVVTIETKYNDWALLLKNSYLTATYAIINEVCLEFRWPNHSISICNDEHRYSVLRTEIGLEGSDQTPNRVIVQPSGIILKGRVTGLASLTPYLVLPETGLRSALQLFPRPIRAKELVSRHTQEANRRSSIVLRSLKPSFGGMQRPRARGLTAAITPTDEHPTMEAMSDGVVKEAVPELEVEVQTVIIQGRHNQDI
ncbi:Ubiquitin-60S ribosomal protein L40 [Paramyrothecium foliicola]|nr:Ubiquitin-60S ribosomal protein L40 [Paramyrothecium foliicola]